MIEREIHAAVITGPTGAIGTALCEILAQYGIEVYAVCRPGSTRIHALPSDSRIHVVFCDLSDLAELPTLLPETHADVFYHFGWAHTIGSGRNDMYAQIHNVQYAIDAVHAAHELGCKVFIGAGSQAEYGRVEGELTPSTPAFPENGYGIAKLCAGQMTRIECSKLGMDHIWPRILSVYGPGDGEMTMISSAIRTLMRGEKPLFTPGEQEWDYLYSKDAAKAFYLMALHGINGSIYPLGSGTTRMLKDYIETVRNEIDPSLPIGLGEVAYSPLQVMYLKADISKLKKDTGFIPETSFEKGIKETVGWYKR